jgi:CO dehydrogenase maturation factor
MKMVICGKGGSGKSTIIALLARHYAQTGRQVLVVDTDESNAGLHRLLGIDAPRDLMEFFGGKKSMMDALRDSREKNAPSPLDKAADIEDIPGLYITKKDGINLVAIGKIHQAGEGCACPMGVLAKQFISGLKLSANDIVLIDTEAGIEHFGRGIDKVCNVILMVIDPSFESLHLAQAVAEMAGSIEVPLYYVLNKTDENTSLALQNAIHDKTRIIGDLRQDPNLLTAGLEGKTVPGDYTAIAGIVNALNV